MLLTFEFTVASRYLRSRRRESFISIIAGFSLLGVTLGVATLIVVLSVMNGFRSELLGRVLGINGHIIVQDARGPFLDFDVTAEAVRQVNSVKRVTPIIEAQVMATSAHNVSGALVRGIRPKDLAARNLISQGILRGSLKEFVGGGNVVVGGRLAKLLRLDVGDSIRLISAKGTSTAIGTVPRGRIYTIVATFDVGMYEYDSTFIFMPLNDAQKLFRLNNAVAALEVVLDDPLAVNEVGPNISKVVGNRRMVRDWRDLNSHYFTALEVERSVMLLILTLIVLVAAFNIVSSLIMLVNDKRRDIAILRTMGATPGMIMRLFFIVGASIGVIGTGVGLVLGILIAQNIQTLRGWIEGLTQADLFAAEIYFLAHLPSEVVVEEVILVALIALGLSLLATIYPSLRASRIDPVEALRND